MRYILVFLALACVVFHTQAQPFSGADGEALSAEALTPLLSDIESLENILSELNEAAAATSRSRALKMLSELAPNEQQRNWVSKQTLSSQKIEIVNPDHPEQLITTVNVANAAKTTQFIWQVNQLADQYLIEISANNWQWALFNQTDKASVIAFDKTMTNLSLAQITQLQQSLTSQAFLTKATNRTLATLLSAKANAQLTTQLFENKADEYSYQQLAKVSASYNQKQAVSLLAVAAKNQHLLSMSLLELSTQHADTSEARKELIKHLKSKQNAWLAAAAISQTHSDALKQQVKQLQVESKTKAVVFANKALEEAKL